MGKESPKKVEDEKPSSRIWEGTTASKKELEKLDRSRKDGHMSPKSQPTSNIYMSEGNEKVSGFLDSDDDEDEERPNSFLNKWVGKFKNVVGDKKITKEDLGEVMVDLKQKLMEKNVAQEVAVKVICKLPLLVCS